MLTKPDIDAFREWLANPLPGWNETCDECERPAVVTLTVDGKTQRACIAHADTLHA